MVLLILLEVVVITAVAVLFSAFSTPFLSGAFTLGIFLLGRSVPDIRRVADAMDSGVGSTVLSTIARIVPNLRYFYVTGTDVEGQRVSVNGVFVDWSYLGLGASYALLYVTLVLLVAMGLFSRRDFV